MAVTQSSRKGPIIESKDSAKGVSIKVLSQKRSCKIELFIPSQHITNHRALKSESKGRFKLEMKFKCKGGKPEYQKGLTLNFSQNYPADEFGIVVSKSASFSIEFEDSDYSGKLTIFLNGYLSTNRIGKIRQSKKEARTRPLYDDRPSPSRYTPYLYNNLRKPYRG